MTNCVFPGELSRRRETINFPGLENSAESKGQHWRNINNAQRPHQSRHAAPDKINKKIEDIHLHFDFQCLAPRYSDFRQITINTAFFSKNKEHMPSYYSATRSTVATFLDAIYFIKMTQKRRNSRNIEK